MVVIFLLWSSRLIPQLYFVILVELYTGGNKQRMYKTTHHYKNILILNKGKTVDQKILILYKTMYFTLW